MAACQNLGLPYPREAFFFVWKKKGLTAADRNDA